MRKTWAATASKDCSEPLARSGLLAEREESFERDGRVIRYRRVFLTREGREAPADGLGEARMLIDPSASRTRRKSGERRPRRPGLRKPAPAAIDPRAAEQDAPPALVDALRSWRLGEARRRKVPAFMILSNRVLLGVAVLQPRDEETLLCVKGVGPAIVRKHGTDILDLVRRHAPAPAGQTE